MTEPTTSPHLRSRGKPRTRVILRQRDSRIDHSWPNLVSIHNAWHPVKQYWVALSRQIDNYTGKSTLRVHFRKPKGREGGGSEWKKSSTLNIPSIPYDVMYGYPLRQDGTWRLARSVELSTSGVESSPRLGWVFRVVIYIQTDWRFMNVRLNHTEGVNIHNMKQYCRNGGFQSLGGGWRMQI